MKTRINNVGARALALTEERALFWVLAAVLVASFALYVAFVQETVRNVVERQKLESEISLLGSHIGELEFKYISMKNDVTIDKAYALGFKDVEETKFVSRKSLGVLVASRMQ